MNDKEIWERMMSGEIYDATHPHLIQKLEKTRELLYDFNNCRPSDANRLKEIISFVLGSHKKFFQINQPFHCDYGENIHIGNYFFANFNLTILDEAEVRIGDYCFIGPNVSIYTACHPLDSENRNKALEWAEPVTIGNNVWIGGNTVILPGVTIGNNVVVGAGSVVTKSIPDNVVIAGNPAKIIKQTD
ncbi:MAG: sugar O-acetyltransferase [Muribaculaceae bacterium]|nr:sugar O-acetyltransferase [Muribaculaceae bacterium]